MSRDCNVMKATPGFSKTVLAILTGAICMTASLSTQAQEDAPGFDDRVYLAPLASWRFIDEGQDRVDPDDAFGAHLSIGKPFNQYFSVELFGSITPDSDLQNTPAGDLETREYGLSGLYFPVPDTAPIYGVASVGTGDYEFNRTGNPALEGSQDGDFFDLGMGFVLPLNALGIPDNVGLSIRGEYRYRKSDVDDVLGGLEFDGHLIQIGLQIPLGPKPSATTPSKAQPEPIVAGPTDSDADGVHDEDDDCPGTPAGTKVNANGCPAEKDAPIVLRGVTFAYDTATLDENAKDRLDNVTAALKAADRINIRIEGHTDSIGGAEFNLRLSQDRADSVKDYLVDHGIDADRLTTRGFGETRPVAPNTNPDGSDNPDGRAENRRVELHVRDDE